MRSIAEVLIPWQKKYGRQHLPWQGNDDPYKVWLSEIMLQQTQVTTVIPYYQRFIQRFPDIERLGQARIDDVLALWSGLGYYSRARNLHRTACLVMQEYQGKFPQTRESMQLLPGIGRSTAAAITVFAYGQCEAILDGNVKRVFARYFGIESYPGKPDTLRILWQLAENSLPKSRSSRDIKVYTQALMDLGAIICTRRKPLCTQCPLQVSCEAYRQDRVVELPIPKPRSKLPEKQTFFIIYKKKQELLLEKRPNQGVWGGLWCFPECGTDNAMVMFTQNVQPIELPQLKHTFTHFKLWITPQLLEVDHEINATDNQVIWAKPDQALALAIPIPVKKLIQQHFL